MTAAAAHIDDQYQGSLDGLYPVLAGGFLGEWSEVEGGVRMGCPVRPGEGHVVHAVERRPSDVEFACDHGCAEDAIRVAVGVAKALAAEPDRLLDELAAFVRRYVVISEAQASAIALWIAHTYVIDAADATPYLGVTSAEMRSGKSRLLEVLTYLVARPLATANMSDAALFRSIEQHRPTLLFDETDAIFSRSRDREDLRGMINAGHRRGAEVWRVGGPNRDRLERFNVFAPKALFGIGKLPNTVADRCIPIRLERRAPGERIARLRPRKVRPLAQSLSDRLEDFAAAALGELLESEPELPEELDDRAQDGAEPLLAIADLAGGDWPRRARDALLELYEAHEGEDDSLGVRLLADIREAFAVTDEDRLSTAALLGHLHGIDDAPWPEWYGRPLSAQGLSKLLSPYRVRSRSVRLKDGSTPKGYRREQFEEVWKRYLPAIGADSRHNATTRTGTDFSADSQPPREAGVAAGEKAQNPHATGMWRMWRLEGREGGRSTPTPSLSRPSWSFRAPMRRARRDHRHREHRPPPHRRRAGRALAGSEVMDLCGHAGRAHPDRPPRPLLPLPPRGHRAVRARGRAVGVSVNRATTIRDDLLANLSELRFLAEAKADALHPKVTGAGAESRVLRAPRSTEDECLEIYEQANHDVRQRIDHERRRPAVRETVKQRDYWIIHGGEGRRASEVAEKYGVEVSTVREIRKSAGRNVETGRPRVRRDKRTSGGVQ